MYIRTCTRSRSQKFVNQLLLSLLLTLLACDDQDSQPNSHSASMGTLELVVELPRFEEELSQQEALDTAAQDLIEASRQITGLAQEMGTDTSQETNLTRIVVRLNTDLLSDLGNEGYQLESQDQQVIVTAAQALGAAYGLYHIAGDLGARYIHPEQSVFPLNRKIQLPSYDGQNQRPFYARRGFHEHTQHPIVMSEFMLKAGQEGYRSWVSNYLKWLLRNRQNTLTFHLLNTVDLDTWIPYLSDITAEAKQLGIEIGFITGFVDQQQNAFRLVMPDDPRSPEEQIVEKLDLLTSTGISLMGLQLGTSEFTKPDEEQVLAWLNLATAHLAMTRPELELYAWIHITCGLNQEDGTPYYHLPLQANERLGAFVHTTMFYTLDHPAPVYDCEDFTHQKDFLEEANGQRTQVFFPETAWWLGFDNNVPLVNPITGLSREYDILNALSPWEVTGHVTFTTGKEWTYWQYDHYLTQVTWQGDLTWSEYLNWLSPIYGEYADHVVRLIDEWGRQQWQDIYEVNPEVYFYLAGELPQDELGEQAGVLARRPKLAYRKILDYSDSDFIAWQTSDLAMLQEMYERYQAILEDLPPFEEDETASHLSGAPTLYLEVSRAYQLFVQRIAHAIALYEGVTHVREGQRENAEAKLALAQEIGQSALGQIAEVESHYRYPLSLLTAELPDSLTAYPFGYLHETSTGYFWLRREEQFAQLISDAFDAPTEEWDTELVGSLYLAPGDSIVLQEPMSTVLQGALGGFVPQLLLSAVVLSEEEQSMNEQLSEDEQGQAFILAQDHNLNRTPDPQTNVRFFAQLQPTTEVDQNSQIRQASVDRYPLFVRDAAGIEIGQLTLNQLQIHLLSSLGENSTDHSDYQSLLLEGEVTPEEVISLVTSVAGIEPEALAQLMKNIWGLPADEDLPSFLPLKAQFTLQKDEIIP